MAPPESVEQPKAKDGQVRRRAWRALPCQRRHFGHAGGAHRGEVAAVEHALPVVALARRRVLAAREAERLGDRFLHEARVGHRACMVKRSEIGILGAALRRSHGFSAESEVLGLSSRVRRAASSLQMQSEGAVLARYGPTKTAILRGRPV